jgi:toxin ParE1/3/4
MTARFLPEADEEFREAARYYESEVHGLGLRFVAEVHRVLSLLAANPEIGSPIVGDLRKMPLKRFPYQLIYLSEVEGVVIVAVAHHKRRPHYWCKRQMN